MMSEDFCFVSAMADVRMYYSAFTGASRSAVRVEFHQAFRGYACTAFVAGRGKWTALGDDEACALHALVLVLKESATSQVSA